MALLLQYVSQGAAPWRKRAYPHQEAYWLWGKRVAGAAMKTSCLELDCL